MTEHKHTPGPWKVSASIDSEFVGVFPDTGEHAFPICKMPDFIKRDVNEANALLIAAAPDLLDALRRARGVLDVIGGYTDRLARCDAAIAKAEGKS